MYAALLVTPDGDYVITYESKTKDEVIEKLINRGSNWHFYPIEFIKYPFNPNGYIVDHPYGTLGWPDRKIKIKKVLDAFKKASKFLEENNLEINDLNDYIELVAGFLNKRRVSNVYNNRCENRR